MKHETIDLSLPSELWLLLFENIGHVYLDAFSCLFPDSVPDYELFSNNLLDQFENNPTFDLSYSLFLRRLSMPDKPHILNKDELKPVHIAKIFIELTKYNSLEKSVKLRFFLNALNNHFHCDDVKLTEDVFFKEIQNHGAYNIFSRTKLVFERYTLHKKYNPWAFAFMGAYNRAWFVNPRSFDSMHQKIENINMAPFLVKISHSSEVCSHVALGLNIVHFSKPPQKTIRTKRKASCELKKSDV